MELVAIEDLGTVLVLKVVVVLVVLSVDLEVASVGSAVVLRIVVSVVEVAEAVLEIAGVVPMISPVIHNALFKRK